MNKIDFYNICFTDFLLKFLYPKLYSIGFNRLNDENVESSCGKEVLIKNDLEVVIIFSVHHLDYPDTYVKVEVSKIVRFLFLCKIRKTLFAYESKYHEDIDVEEDLYNKFNEFLKKNEI